MDAHEVLGLFDSYWFHQQILTSLPKPSQDPTPPEPETLETDSLSDRMGSQTSSQSELQCHQSPKSVLLSHRLQPILSGKEVTETQDQTQEIRRHRSPNRSGELQSERAAAPIRGSGEKRRSRAKSMSDLEFEELKGFIDLGFVFKEEDRNSRLGEIIPGLQRMGGGGAEGGDEAHEERGRSDGPYLSEAWGAGGRRRGVVNPFVNWRVPSADLGSEIAMKDHLRNWAHTVASTVR